MRRVPPFPRPAHTGLGRPRAVVTLVFFLLFVHAPSAFASFPIQGTLAWDAVDDPAVEGYKVHYGTTSGDYDTTVDVGPETAFPLMGLDEEVTYYFAVTAYDTNLVDTDYSEEIAHKVLTADPDGDSQMPGCSGNLPADPSYQLGVSFAFDGREGDYRLAYRAYDIELPDQVEILVNGTSYGYLPTTAVGGYSDTVEIDLPDDLVSHDGYNIVRFIPNFEPPDAYNWGVCDVTLNSRALAITDDGWYGNMGGIPDGDQDHLDHVQFLYDAPAQVPPEGIPLRFCVFDVDNASEIEILVNGVCLCYAPVTANNGYSDLLQITIPPGMLVPGETNVITFANTYNPANTYRWGVGAVSIFDNCPDCIPLPDPEAYGRIMSGDQTHIERVDYSFQGMGGDVIVPYDIWDVDFSGEVEILVNNVPVDYAPITGNETWSESTHVLLPDEWVLDTGLNVLTFDNLWNPPRTYWWGVRNVSLFEECTDCIVLPDTGAYGRISGGDLSHTNEVNYAFEGTSGDVAIVYQVWDVDFSDEVEVLVNGVPLEHALITPNATWSGTRFLTIPDALVSDTGFNVLSFNNTYNPTRTYAWGVRNVSILGDCPDCIPLPDSGAYGYIQGGDQSHEEEVSYSFEGAPGDMDLGYRVWDVDFSDEVEILVNDVHLDYAPVTANTTWSDTVSLVIPDEWVLDAGTNVITFSNTRNPPNTYWWGVSDVSVE